MESWYCPYQYENLCDSSDSTGSIHMYKVYCANEFWKHANSLNRWYQTCHRDSVKCKDLHELKFNQRF